MVLQAFRESCEISVFVASRFPKCRFLKIIIFHSFYNGFCTCTINVFAVAAEQLWRNILLGFFLSVDSQGAWLQMPQWCPISRTVSGFFKSVFLLGTELGHSSKCPSGVPPFKMKIQASRGFVRLGSHWGIPENGPVMSVLSVCCLGQGYVTSVGGDSM